MAEPAAILNLLVTANTKQANAALAGTQAQLQKTAATGKASSATLAKGLGVIGVAAGAAAAGLFKIGEAFDDSADKIRTQTGATGKELRKLETNFKNVVKSVPADFDSASDAVAGLNQRLDLTGKPLERLSRQMLELSRITETDIGANVKSVTRLFGDWEVETEKQTKTLDKLYRASQETGITVGELSDLMVQFGSPLRQLGLDFDTAAAMFSRFEKEGVNMQTLLPGLRMALKNFSQPTDELSKKFRQLGIDLRDGPAKALRDVFEQLERAPSDLKANALAFEIFGARAGPDMAAAVREGRFELDKLIGTIQNGDDTIRKSGRATMDFAEHWQRFKNNVMVALEPIASRVFKIMGDGMKALSRLDLDKAIQSLKDFWKEAGVVREVITTVVKIVRGALGKLAEDVKNAVKLIASVLRGDFGAAWDAVKDIFRSGVKLALAPIRGAISLTKAIAGKIGDGLESAFGGAWDRITGIFESGVNTAIDFLNLIIKALNVIPGVDIGLIGKVGSNETGSGETVNANVGRHAIGGKVTTPMAIVGEEAPAHPEYVLATNPAYRNRNLGLWEQAGKALGVPGFAKGGVLPTNTGGAVLDSASSVIDKFPSPSSLPGWLQGSGKYAIQKAAEFARDKVANLAEATAGIVTGGMTKELGGTWQKANALAQKFGLTITSAYRTPEHNAAVGGVQGSSHTRGSPENPGAHDFVPPQGAPGTPGAAGLYAMNKLGAIWADNHDFGSGLHLHVSWFKKGGIFAKGIVQALAKGGVLGKGTGAGEPLGREIPSALQKYNKTYPKNVGGGGYAMPADHVAMLAEYFGMPGVTMAQIARGESAYGPGAVGDDAAAGYGNTFGYGLWQITTGQGHDPYVNRLGGWDEMLNPIKNAVVAAKLYKASGVSPWYGTRYMTGENLHWNGDFGNVASPGGSGGGGNQGGGKEDKPTKPQGGVTGGEYSPWALDFSYDRASGLSATVRNAMKIARTGIDLADEMIANQEIMDAMPSSENGSDLGPFERLNQIALNEGLLWSLESMRAWVKQGLGTKKLKPTVKARLLENLTGLEGITGQGGRILDVKAKLDELRNPENTTTGTDWQALYELAQQTAAESNLRYLVSQAQYKVLANTPYMGAFAAGGVALVGENGPELAHLPSGTRVHSNEETQSMLTPTVTINGDIVQALGDTRPPIEVNGARAIVEQGGRGMARRPFIGAGRGH